jgi:hypothetical protein
MNVRLRQKTVMKISIEKLLRIFAVIAIVNIIIISYLYFLFPDLRDFLVAEDRLTEDLTALFYLLSFSLGIFLISRIKEKKYRRIYLAIPVIGLLGFLEELSYGERIFKFKTPLIYNEYFDALHDLLPIAVNYLQLHATFLLFVLPVLFFVLIAVVMLKYRRYIPGIPEFISSYPPTGFFLIAAGMILFAQVYDLNLVKPDFAKLIEELFEMNGSLALLFSVLSMRHVFTEDNSAEKKPDVIRKKLSFSFLIIFSFFILMGAASYFIFYVNTESLARESEAYLDNVIPQVFTSWNSEVFLDQLVPELHPGEAQNRKIRTSFALQSQRFGSMKTYKRTGSETIEKYKKLEYFQHGDNIRVFTNFAEALFEKSPANLRIVTIKREGKWSILGLKIDPVK